MPEIIFIDTTPGINNPYAAPSHIEDYKLWLEDKYHASCRSEDGKTVCFGMAQKINQVIYQARRNNKVIAVKGPHAADAAKAIKNIAGIDIEPIVLEPVNEVTA